MMMRRFSRMILRTTSSSSNTPGVYNYRTSTFQKNYVSFSSKTHVSSSSSSSLDYGVTSTKFADHAMAIAALQKQLRQALTDGDVTTAQVLATECVDKIKLHYGEAHPAYASSLNNLGMVQKELGEFDLAIESYNLSLAVYKDAVGESHASFITALTNLGIVHRTYASSGIKGIEQLKHLDKALDYFTLAQDLNVKSCAAEDPKIAVGLGHIGTVQFHRGQKQEAVKTLREAVAALHATLGSAPHTLTATAMNNLALVLKGTDDQFDEAIDLYQQVVQTRKTLLGHTHPHTITAMHNLSEVYRSQGDEARSAELQTQILTLLDEKE